MLKFSLLGFRQLEGVFVNEICNYAGLKSLNKAKVKSKSSKMIMALCEDYQRNFEGLIPSDSPLRTYHKYMLINAILKAKTSRVAHAHY